MFIEAKDDGGGGDNWTIGTGAISRAKLQSNHHHQQTNIQFFTGRMPFLSPNQQCQRTEGKISHSMDLLTPSSPGGLPTFSLTTNICYILTQRFFTGKSCNRPSRLRHHLGEGCHASHQPSDACTPPLLCSYLHHLYYILQGAQSMTTKKGFRDVTIFNKQIKEKTYI